MHSSTRAQPISSFSSHGPDPYYLFPDGSVLRDLSDHLDKVSELFRSAMYQLSGIERHKLIKFLGETPHVDFFESVKGVGAYGRIYLHRCRNMGSNNLIFPVATAYEPPTTAQKVAAKLASQTQPDFKIIPADEVVREFLPHAIWRCSELDACDHFESGIEVNIERAVGVSRSQMQQRERF